MTKTSTPPRGTKASGRRLWADVTDRFELDEHELAMLREACRTVDQLDVLAGILATEGLIWATSLIRRWWSPGSCGSYSPGWWRRCGCLTTLPYDRSDVGLPVARTGLR